MNICIDIHYAIDPFGVAALHADATITHSPKEGFDNEKIGKLEEDLSTIVTERLNDAIKKRR